MTLLLNSFRCGFTPPVSPCVVACRWDSASQVLDTIKNLVLHGVFVHVEKIHDLLAVTLSYNLIVSVGRDTTFTTDVLLDLVRDRKDTLLRALTELAQRSLGLDYLDALDRAYKIVNSLGIVDVTAKDSTTLPEEVLSIERSIRLKIRGRVEEESELIEVEVTADTVRDVTLLVLYKLLVDVPRTVIVHGRRATCILDEGRKVKLVV